ncbi:MAG TPA: cytochrome c [Cyclobacteriaceae bacterium]|jgi:mono/diheme cytochrome c family protein
MKNLILTAFIFFSYLLITACTVEPRKTVPKEFKVGQTHFHRVCANCHGPDAMGGNKAPKLVQEKYSSKNFSNGKIARTILNGSNSGSMPSQKGKVSDKEIKEIIKYLRYSQKIYKAAS